MQALQPFGHSALTTLLTFSSYLAGCNVLVFHIQDYKTTADGGHVLLCSPISCALSAALMHCHRWRPAAVVNLVALPGLRCKLIQRLLLILTQQSPACMPSHSL